MEEKVTHVRAAAPGSEFSSEEMASMNGQTKAFFAKPVD